MNLCRRKRAQSRLSLPPAVRLCSPIMGVGAFIMAETLSMNDLQIAADAIIPALAYYFGVFVLVSFLAKKHTAAKTRRLRFAIRLILTALIEIGLSESSPKRIYEEDARKSFRLASSLYISEYQKHGFRLFFYVVQESCSPSFRGGEQLFVYAQSGLNPPSFPHQSAKFENLAHAGVF